MDFIFETGLWETREQRPEVNELHFNINFSNSMYNLTRNLGAKLGHMDPLQAAGNYRET